MFAVAVAVAVSWCRCVVVPLCPGVPLVVRFPVVSFLLCPYAQRSPSCCVPPEVATFLHSWVWEVELGESHMSASSSRPGDSLSIR